ncbi:MAG: AMP-binding protein [Sedimentisphaerales bacterium]|nr:AMP-binding protein [Sedimentisphaerales bacterium]
MPVDFDPVLVHEWLRRSARRVPEKDAIICGSQRWSYRRLDACSDHFAEALVGLGMCRQDRVAILTGNRPETVVSLYGTLKAGGVFVILDGNTKAQRLAYILANSGARILVGRMDQAAVIREALEDLNAGIAVVWVGAASPPEGCAGVTWDSVLEAGSSCSGDGHVILSGRAPCIDIDLASLIYTSATTGNPKGVMSTHHNMISAARSIIQYIQNESSDVILDALPLSFDYGLYQVIMAVMFGGTVVLEPSFVYLHNILTRIAEEKVSGFPVVPTMVAMLLKMRDLRDYDLRSLRYLTNTGAALPVQHIQSLRELLPHVKIFSMFGLTECKRVGYLDPEELDRRPGSVGKAMPNCEVSVVDEDGNEVRSGEVGELVIRGSNVMQGYWNDPDMTAKVYQPGPYPASRWLRSGDYFRSDEDGFLYFLGRKDDMIKTRGERVSPKEVENALCELGDVAEAAVVGVPDEILGQAIKAFIVTRLGRLDEKAVLRHCAERLGSFMVPKYVEFVAALPRTAHGKVDRRRLQTVEGR